MVKALDDSASPFMKAVLQELIEPDVVVTTEEGDRTCRRTSEELIERALRASHGNVTHAARKLGVTRYALQLRIRASDLLKAVLVEARESLLDAAESGIARGIEAGEGWATIWCLKCLGRGRGWIEKPPDKPTQAVSINMSVVVETVPPSQEELARRRGEEPPPPPLPPQLPAPDDGNGNGGFF